MRIAKITKRRTRALAAQELLKVSYEYRNKEIILLFVCKMHILKIFFH